MKRCAFLSMESLEGFFSYDELLIEPLSELGWSVEQIPWRTRGTRWEEFDVVLIRTPWDYYHDTNAFLEVLRSIHEVTHLENPIDIVTWNLDKHYLLELERRGVEIVPTILIDRTEPDRAIESAGALGSNDLILKPVISANAENTYRMPLGRLDLSRLGQLEQDLWLVQPFVRSIIEQGESSLFYFGGRFSHAITKKPALGDFRVQEEHGGHLRSIQPDDELRAAGDKAVDAIGKTLLYARVDLVRHEDRWCLMELELIEPSLYFNMDPESPARFATIFDGWMRDRR